MIVLPEEISTEMLGTINFLPVYRSKTGLQYSSQTSNNFSKRVPVPRIFLPHHFDNLHL